MRVLFASSSTSNSKKFKIFLTTKGVKIVDSVSDSTILCIGRTNLKKTSKLIMAVILGKEVVSDKWVIDSVKADKILDIDNFKARDIAKEKTWNVNLSEAIERGKRGLKVLQGWTIFFTPSAKIAIGTSGFNELKEISRLSGAKTFSELPKKTPEDLPDTLIIVIENDSALYRLKDDQRYFSRDIIGLSVLRGKIDTTNDEFLIVRQKPEGGKKRKRR